MAKRAALEQTKEPMLHVFFHQRRTVWHGWCIEFGSSSAYGPSQDAVRRMVYEELKRQGVREVLVVEEIVQRGRIDLESGSIHL